MVKLRSEATKDVNSADNTDTNDKSSGMASTQQLTSSVAGQSLTVTESALFSTESEFEIVVNLSSDVLFEFDRYTIKQEADRELMKLHSLIAEKGEGNVRIIGHTDGKGKGKGKHDYNMTLSLNRAEAVAGWLKNKGLGPSITLTTEGLGSKQPIAQTRNPTALMIRRDDRRTGELKLL